MLRIRSLILLLACFLMLSGSAFSAETEEKSWTGGWNNRKYRTNGPLTCTVTSQEKSTWKATFTGKGIGRPFRYEVSFTAMKKGNITYLRGTSKLKGDVYQWVGQIRGKVLYGRYRSGSGNNGEMRLQEKQ